MAYTLRQHRRTHYEKRENPELMTVSTSSDIATDAELQQVLDHVSFAAMRYGALPEWALVFGMKLLSYRGANPAIRSLGSAILSLFRRDMARNGHLEGMPHIVRALKYALGERRSRLSRKLALDPQRYGSKIGYDSESGDLAIALRYKALVDTSAHFETEEERLGTQFYFAVYNTTRFLKSDPAIKRFINFGASFGVVDFELAKLNPDVRFYGVDRAKLVKQLNEDNFCAPNLEFIAAKITDFISEAGDLSDTAFMHMRTMMIFPESFVKDLFDQLATKNVRAIVGMEPFGYSLPEKSVFIFSSSYKPSITYRGNNLIHNYPYWVSHAGLQVVDEQWLKSPKLPKNETSLNRMYAYIGATTR